MRGRAGLLLVVFVWVISTGGASAAVRAEGALAPATASAQQIAQIRDLESEAIAVINRLRRERGLHELRPSKALSMAAAGHSVSMATYGFFGHEGYDGTPFGQRIKPLYEPLPNASWRVGENLVWSSQGLSAGAAIDLWLKSPHHREIMFRPAWREVGIGAVRAFAAPGVFRGLDVTILTADFGAR